jgi:hypothetical protein
MGKAGAFRDRVNPDAVEAAFAKHRRGCIDDPFAVLLRLLPAHAHVCLPFANPA